METMRSFDRIGAEPVSWVGHGWVKRSYELKSESALFATLAWESAFGSLARAKTANAEWTLKRVGFFNPKATVRASEGEADLAVYHPDWIGNGRVELPGGKAWRWKCLGFWRSRYGFVDEAEQPIVEFHANTLKVPPSAEVVIAHGGLKLPELPLLVVLGWYVTILTFDDMVTIAAVS